MQYTCPDCGKTHTDWPALGYSSPDNYANLSQEEKDSIAELTTDFCTINYPDETDRFIRVVMTQKVNGHCEDLEYGFWVSLSEQSFANYSENYNNQNHEAQYFGWLCNDIPQYDFPDSIPTTVVTQAKGRRPEIFPHEDFDHPFVKDYYNGITKAEAEKRIKEMIKVTSGKKPWWKFLITTYAFFVLISCTEKQEIKKYSVTNKSFNLLKGEWISTSNSLSGISVRDNKLAFFSNMEFSSDDIYEFQAIDSINGNTNEVTSYLMLKDLSDTIYFKIKDFKKNSLKLEIDNNVEEFKLKPNPAQ